MLEYIIGATLAVSLLSLAGVTLLGLNQDLLKKVLVLLVAFAVGGMLGGALFHLIPEALEAGEAMWIFALTLTGFLGFFVIEKFLHWRHCHDPECEMHALDTHEKGKKSKSAVKPLAYLNLIGDMVHNFMDGVIIATSFMTSIPLGVASTIAIALHEIPQEFGDFAVLVHSGLDVKKALFYNFLSAVSAVMGGVAAYFLIIGAEGVESLLLPIAAGGFIYIAAVDLVPELHKERRPLISALQLGAIVFGLALMYYMKTALGG